MILTGTKQPAVLMRKPFQIALILAGLWCLPGVARSQWATTETELDWRLKLSGHSYGLTQEVVRPGDYRTMTFHLGVASRSCRARTGWIVVGGLGLAVAVGGILGLTTQRNGASHLDPSC